MPWSEDFSPLLQPGTPNPSFRQGYLLIYNPDTGENTVEVGGGVLTNLPLLNIGDTINLVGEDVAGPNNGDVVIIMKMGNSWGIMGRVVAPNSGQFARSVVATESKSAFESGFEILTADTFEGITADFTVPGWATRVDLTITCTIAAYNPTGSNGFLYLYASSDLGNGVEIFTRANSLDYATITTSHVASATGSIGGDTFRAYCAVSTDAATGDWLENLGFNRAQTSALAVYTRT